MKLAPLVAVAASLIVPSLASAQTDVTQTDARDYEALTSLPSNSAAGLGYFRHASSSDSSNYSESLANFRALYIVKFGNLALVPFDAMMPVVDVNVYSPAAPPSVGSTTLHTSGLGDATYLPTVGYSVSEDDEAHTHTYFAFTPFITAPTGNYSSTNLVNIGDHRWRVQPQLVVGQRFMKAFTAELEGNVVFYTDNTAFGLPTGGTVTMKQDMTIGMEAHLAVDFSPTFYASISYYLDAVGKQTLQTPAGTAPLTDEQTIQTLRFTYGINVTKGTNLLLQFNQDIEASGGATIGRFFGARIAQIF
jgi:outer membrane putative beta-barrel porin/alpha-amylase